MAQFLAAVTERATTVAGGRRIRLGVIALRPTDSPRYRDQGFGSFVTERISSALGGPDSPVRLFERERLDAVLEEQKLSASGLFDDNAAKQLGELVPIDVILTGSFTRLDRTAAFNLRFIDVVTGEVRGNLAANMALTPELAALFQDVQALPAATKADDKHKCDRTWAPVLAAMKDVGSPEKLDHLVDTATAIAFDDPCGALHYEVLAFFRRYKQAPPRYGAFLLKTLQGMETPDEDNRASSISRYLLTQGPLEDPAWMALARLAGRSKRPHDYLDALLNDPKGAEASRNRLQTRIKALLDQAGRNSFGRPVPESPQTLFSAIMAALRTTCLSGYGASKDVRPLLDCYRTFGPRFAAEQDKRLVDTLVALHDACPPGPERMETLRWIGERFRGFQPSRELEEAMRPFLERLFEARAKARKEDPTGGLPGRELQALVALCGDRIVQTIPFIRGRGYTLDFQGFCIENELKAEGLVPTVDALIGQLSNESSGEKREAVQLLKAFGPRALPAEPAILKLARRSGRGDVSDGQDRYVLHDLLELLGAMGTRNPEAIKLLVRYLGDQESYLAEAAVGSLAQVGEPAVAGLQAEFPRLAEPYKKIRVVQVFQLRGHQARPHLAWLNAKLKETDSSYVKDALEDAIEAVR